MRKLKRRETEALFEQLGGLRVGDQDAGAPPVDPPHWIVNPAVHQRFAERGRAEAERRARERAIIAELKGKPS